MHVRESRALAALDDPTHRIGIAAFRGLAILAGARGLRTGTRGGSTSATARGRSTATRSGRSRTARRSASSTPGGRRRRGEGAAIEATFGEIAGTGRFAGATGAGRFSGRRLEPAEAGGATYATGALVITTPD
jgi:hypothetical protein